MTDWIERMWVDHYNGFIWSVVAAILILGIGLGTVLTVLNP